MTVFRHVYCYLFTLVLGGCAEWSSIQYQFPAAPDKVATIDAKQRVVTMQTLQLQNIGSRISVCVEQSPDAFSFLSGSLSASTETKSIAAALAAAIAESGGSLAFRTQVTQAQANLLYSICTLYAAGAVNDRAVRTELRRFQQTLLGMLAIEQLTAPQRGQPMQQILTTSSASVGKDVDLAQANVKDALDAKSKAQIGLDDANKKVETNKPKKDGEAESDAYKAAVKERGEKQKVLDDAASKLTIAEKSLAAASLALNASASGAQQSVINVYASSGNSISDKVAEQIVSALDFVLQRGVLVDSCTELLLEGKTDGLLPISVEICRSALQTYTDAYKNANAANIKIATDEVANRTQILKELMALYKSGKILPADYLKGLLAQSDETKSGSPTLLKPPYMLELPPPRPYLSTLGK